MRCAARLRSHSFAYHLVVEDGEHDCERIRIRGTWSPRMQPTTARVDERCESKAAPLTARPSTRTARESGVQPWRPDSERRSAGWLVGSAVANRSIAQRARLCGAQHCYVAIFWPITWDWDGEHDCERIRIRATLLPRMQPTTARMDERCEPQAVPLTARPSTRTARESGVQPWRPDSERRSAGCRGGSRSPIDQLLHART